MRRGSLGEPVCDRVARLSTLECVLMFVIVLILVVVWVNVHTFVGITHCSCA